MFPCVVSHMLKKLFGDVINKITSPCAIKFTIHSLDFILNLWTMIDSNSLSGLVLWSNMLGNIIIFSIFFSV